MSNLDAAIEALGKGDIRLNTVGNAPIAQLTTINLTGSYGVGEKVEVTIDGIGTLRNVYG